MPATISILGCGYLGMPVARQLLTKGWRVRGSTTRTNKLSTLVAAGIEPFLLRLTPEVEGPFLEDFFRSDTMLINFPPGRRRPDVESFLSQAINALMVRTDHVRHVVFASSTSVYASGNVDESAATVPTTKVGRALRHAESMLTTCPRFTTTVLRLGGLYGYTRKPGRFVRRIRNGAAVVNLVHRDDAVAVIVHVVAHPAQDRLLNVVADVHPRKDDFYLLSAQRLGRQTPQIYYDRTMAGKSVSNARLKKELDYEFLYPDPMLPAP